ncbi:hypothetical protein DFA_10126 [Cavenderia fasciculata]|uniref:KxDL domain-containing protein n=1 Tax=Cavenderia fasciculata TaxID=261658 RepID=F4Q9C3_CACFS|nr:uncharacterized protein DFA_10126 [Cavenderia fasciculata]EGG15292.1 hypothetical protein DFA_10126 [Cavenderia fasciculata]|eukprot:XP_004352012.1 hypothetical protein DFA_10126 [Cavenderia fasciculata]
MENQDNHNQNSHNEDDQNQNREQTTMTTLQQPTASQTMTNEITNITSQNDIYNILSTQTEILTKQYETNNALQHFNEYSSQKYGQLSNDFEKHTKMLKDMKKDLDYIFRKTRQLQGLLNDKFPNIKVEQTTYIVEDD